MRETWVQSPGQDHPLEKEMASHSSTLAWKIPWSDEPAWPKAIGKQSIVSKGPSSQSCGFSSGHVWIWELNYKENWTLKNWCFWTVVLEKTLESPLDCKEIQPVHPEGNQSWVLIGRTDAEAETPILWPPDVKNWPIGRDPDSGKYWRQEKGMTEDEMVGWHHQLDGHEFEKAPGVGDGQGSLALLQSMRSQRVRHSWATELTDIYFKMLGKWSWILTFIFSILFWLLEPSQIFKFKVSIWVQSRWPEAVLCLVTLSCTTLCNLMEYGPPDSSVHRNLQARTLEWAAMPSSKGSSQPRDRAQVSTLQVDSLLSELPEKPTSTGVGKYPFSRASSQPRNQTRVSCIAGRFLSSWATRKAQLSEGFSLKFHRLGERVLCILHS